MHCFSLFQNELLPKKVEVELHTRFQVPSFQILGLPAPEIQEARERIVAAFTASGLEFPKKKVMVNLTPSSERKTGTGHDLAIALKVLAEVLELIVDEQQQVYAWGELGLDGSIKPCGYTAKWVELILKEKIRLLFMAPEDRSLLLQLLQWRKAQGLPVPGELNVVAVKTLYEVAELFSDRSFFTSDHPNSLLSKIPSSFTAEPENISLLPLSPYLERAIKVAMVGRHHLLILGPKGMGKSQALEWIGKISPPPAPLQTWERILQSEASRERLEFKTPLRRVHANLRPTHLLGTWNTQGFQAGELSQAHGGILVADEFLEWPRDAKECLREPLEQKSYSLIRKQGRAQVACDVQFVGTGNLCRCGGLPDGFKLFVSGATVRKKNNFPPCRCQHSEVHHYLCKLSGPVADRIDLILIHAEKPKMEKISFKNAPSIIPLKEEILSAREFALSTFGTLPSQLTVAWLEENLPADLPAESVLGNVNSLRSRHKILRVARSVQALERSSILKIEHLWEAAGYRFEGLPN